MSPIDTAHIQPLRIAMLSLHSSPLGPLGTRDTGGMSVYVREVAREMARSGHSIDIYTYAPCDAPVTRLHRNVRLIQLNHENEKTVSKEALAGHITEMAGRLDAFAHRHRLAYDLIHSHYWISGCVGDILSRKWRCPHTITFHTLGRVKNATTEDEDEPDARISQEGRLVGAVDAVVVPSDPERQYLLDLYRAPSGKVHTIPCGVNMTRFQPADQGEARTTLNIDPLAAVLLFVGRFAPVKGMTALLDAVAELARFQTPVKLVVVGGDGEKDGTTLAVERRARELGIARRLHLAGRIDHGRLPLYYNAADMLVLPSFYESFGLVTLESLACGTPVVATRVGGAAAVVKDGVNGTLIDHPDGSGLARAIGQVLNQVRHGELTARNIRQSVAPYGWSRVAAAILKVYRGLTGVTGLH